ncbi:hypothetical protein Tco_0174026 [Tanacetum coccineum]
MELRFVQQRTLLIIMKELDLSFHTKRQCQGTPQHNDIVERQNRTPCPRHSDNANLFPRHQPDVFFRAEAVAYCPLRRCGFISSVKRCNESSSCAPSLHKELPTSDMNSHPRMNVEDFDVDKAQGGNKKKVSKYSLKTPLGSPTHSPPTSSSTTVRRRSRLFWHIPEPRFSRELLPPPPPSHPLIRKVQSTATAAPTLNSTIPDDLYMDDETTADEQAYSSGEEMEKCTKLLLIDKVDDAILKSGVIFDTVARLARPALSILKDVGGFLSRYSLLKRPVEQSRTPHAYPKGSSEIEGLYSLDFQNNVPSDFEDSILDKSSRSLENHLSQTDDKKDLKLLRVNLRQEKLG